MILVLLYIEKTFNNDNKLFYVNSSFQNISGAINIFSDNSSNYYYDSVYLTVNSDFQIKPH